MAAVREGVVWRWVIAFGLRVSKVGSVGRWEWVR